MVKDYLINSVKKQYIEVGSSIYNINNEIITEALNTNNTDIILPVTVTKLERGKFYFMFYDLQGKSTNMEKFNPLFVIDWFDIKGTRMIFAVSINFIPVNIRVLLFNMILNYNVNILIDNKDKEINIQKPLQNIDFYKVYNLLKGIGFEWSIRQFDYRLINKLYTISTNSLVEFITMSTHKFTGVDDGKLIQIWQSKLANQDERQNKLIKELMNDYNEINKELNNQYINLQEQNTSLEKSLNIINKMF